LVLGIADAKIIAGKCGGALAGHAAGEHSRKHGGVDNHADALLRAIRQGGLFNLAAQNGVWRLERGDRRDRLCALDLRRVKIAYTDPAYLAFFLQGGHSLPGFFQTGAVIGGRPVHLIQVDRVELQATEAIFAFLADGTRGKRGGDFAIGAPGENALGEYVRPRTAPLFQCARNNFFRMTQTINGSSINPIDSEFKRAVNRRDGVGIFLWTPGKFPTRTAGGPGAESRRSNVKIGIPKFARLHGSFISQQESPWQSRKWGALVG